MNHSCTFGHPCAPRNNADARGGEEYTWRKCSRKRGQKRHSGAALQAARGRTRRRSRGATAAGASRRCSMLRCTMHRVWRCCRTACSLSHQARSVLLQPSHRTATKRGWDLQLDTGLKLGQATAALRARATLATVTLATRRNAITRRANARAESPSMTGQENSF